MPIKGSFLRGKVGPKSDADHSPQAATQLKSTLLFPHTPSGYNTYITGMISRWLPTAAARVRARVWSCGSCGRQSGAGAGFLRVLWFPLPIFIPPISPQSPLYIIWGWYNRPVLAAVPSGLSLTPLIIKKK
jgi:hypothetical protein